MLGSLTFYRRLLNEHVFGNTALRYGPRTSSIESNANKEQAPKKLPTIGHALAGVLAGATVSFVAGQSNNHDHFDIPNVWM